MNNCLTLLLSVKNTASPQSADYQIANYLIKNFRKLNHITTQTLAQECHVSKSAISRFCRNIGLEDFLDLKLLARSVIEDPRAKFNVPLDDIESNYIEGVYNNLRILKNLVLKYELDELVEDIYNYTQVTLMGHMQSSNPAFNLQYDLAQLGKYVECCDNIRNQREIIKDSTSDDLIIVFSSSGNFFKNLMAKESLLQSCKAKIYMISATPTSLKPDYIYQTFNISKDYNYYSSVINMIVFANIICLKFLSKYKHIYIK